MIEKTNRVMILTRNFIMSIPMVRMLYQSSSNITIFFFLKIVKIEFKMKLQRFFLFGFFSKCLQNLTFHIFHVTYQNEMNKSFPCSSNSIQYDIIFTFKKNIT